MKDIILIGGGGHCKSVIDSIKTGRTYNVIGILDLEKKVGEEINGIEIIATDDSLDYYYDKGIEYAFLTLGSIGNTNLRRNLYLKAHNIGYRFPNIIDSTSMISKTVSLGYGNYIGKGVIINSDANIKNNCIINTGAIVEHDCSINSFSHVGPGVTMSGNVHVETNVHIGAGTTIIQNLKIGKGSMIGAGSVVLRDIMSNRKAYGNPCRDMGVYYR